MKVQLVVADGVHKGKVIPITVPKFAIGRDPQCQLRPSSNVISKQHCIFFVKRDAVILRDLGSTNGTIVNGERLNGEVELNDGDAVTVGPLEFVVKLQKPTAVDRPTKIPTAPAKVVDADDAIGDMLLEMPGDDEPAKPIDPDESTVLDMPALPDQHGNVKPGTKKKELGDTSSAAASILKNYSRRNRN